VLRAAVAGVRWLLDLQNSDGGIPTFCRGWTNLPFDRSAPDLTAHALRAWNAWLPDLPANLQRRMNRAIERGGRYLERAQRPDGSWTPLWFGNQHLPDETNPVYGTAKVLLALAELASAADTMLIRGVQWLLSAQKSDGSWGAPGGRPASVEETALAVEALAAIVESGPATCRPSSSRGRDAVSASLTLEVHAVREAAMRGANWLIEKAESGEWRQPSPIGFYFAKLWYYERLYPQIFTVAALERVACGFKTDAVLLNR
jgi:squalene-hopene/tetraprenyl-beta-curcumene cyclase